MEQIDCLIVGAGLAGLYSLHRFRSLGLRIQGVEAGSDVGGTWFWNRYPGAACDVESIEYSYSFDEAIQKDWNWTQRYASQPEILRYIQHVTERLNLRPLIQFNTRVTAAEFDAATNRWSVSTDRGGKFSARFLIMATGCLSSSKIPDIPGAASFKGQVYRTCEWPHQPVNFAGKRVAVIGTGSTGIQMIPVIAQQADKVIVYQRTPNFSVPAANRPLTEAELKEKKAAYPQIRDAARKSVFGLAVPPNPQMATQSSPEEREKQYQACWERGGLGFLLAYADLVFSKEANDTAAEFVRKHIASVVKDPATAQALMPHDYPIGTKRICIDSGYYETFNRPNVTLVDIRKHPIERIAPEGVVTAAGTHEVDCLVWATGFDAMTGALTSVNIVGTGGRTLKQCWAEQGPVNYLGLSVHGFPNLFMITGPGSPSVLSNMILSIEQHVNWIGAFIEDCRKNKVDRVEATAEAQKAWVTHATDVANMTLFPQANSWYMGANIPGKPRVFMPYPGGVAGYAHKCASVAAAGYEGFELSGAGFSRTVGPKAGPVLAPTLERTTRKVLEMLAAAGGPPLESLAPNDARNVFVGAQAAVPLPGPTCDIAEHDIVSEGLSVKLTVVRPLGVKGALPAALFFHGGGWVLGDFGTHSRLVKELATESGVAIIFARYSLSPEVRYPVAVSECYAATKWVAEHGAEINVDGKRLAVMGVSAGGNLATVVARMAKEKQTPALKAQVLLAPVTNCDFETDSYKQFAEGYFLTRAAMMWFWDQYADPKQRLEPNASPLRATVDELQGLPPALVLVAEHDPLRDEGEAYARKLDAAGVDVSCHRALGLIHDMGLFNMLSQAPATRTLIAFVASQLRGRLQTE